MKKPISIKAVLINAGLILLLSTVSARLVMADEHDLHQSNDAPTVKVSLDHRCLSEEHSSLSLIKAKVVFNGSLIATHVKSLVVSLFKVILGMVTYVLMSVAYLLASFL